MRRRTMGGAWFARRAGPAGALLALVGLTGCGGAPQVTVASVEPEVVQLEVVQLRGDVAGGFIELRVTNPGAHELVVERATYESSAWSAPMERVDEARIPSGGRRNLRLQLPEPTCASGPVEHRATLELEDGTVLEGVPEDPFGHVGTADDLICDLRAFERDVAAVSWLQPDISPDGVGPAVLRLEVSPRPGAAAPLGSIDAVLATVLLAPADAAGQRLEALPVAIGVIAGAAPTVVDVPLVPARCDLHAVAEDKQGTILTIRATAGDEPVDLRLPVPDDQRNALLAWVVASCAR